MCANYSGAPVQDPLRNDLDGGGNSLNNVGAVGVGEINGGFVFLSGYSDLQTAVNDMDAGDCLVLSEEYKTSVYGTAATTKPINAIGSGFVFDDDTDTPSGAYFRVDSNLSNPILQIDGQSTTGGYLRELMFKDFGVYYETGVTGQPLLSHADVADCLWENLFGYMNNEFDTLIEIRSGDNFLNDFIKCRNDRAPGNAPGISFTTTGGGENNFIASTLQGDPALDVTGGNDLRVRGGEIRGKNGGDGIHLRGVDGASISFRSEATNSGIVLDSDSGGTKTRNAHLTDCFFFTLDQYAADFRDSQGCRLVEPTKLEEGSTSGAAVNFSANSTADGVVIAGEQKQVSWDIDASAYNPIVDFADGTYLSDSDRGLIAQPVEGMSFYNPDDGNLNVYDGSGWILPDGTST
jgi:hypothetical protein